jgi:putative ABC transport system substrate-binding protein
MTVKRSRLLLAGLAVILCSHADGQTKLPLVGFLGIRSAAADADVVRAFRSGIAETGFIEGRNIRIAYRWADGDAGRLPGLARELVQLPVDVLVTAGNAAAPAAKAATSTIPIVFSTGADPIRAGLVGSLNRPDGNATGVTTFAQELGAKQVQLVHEIIPNGRVIALLVNPSATDSATQTIAVQQAVKATGQHLIVVNAKTEGELAAAFASAAQHQANALIVSSNGLFNARVKEIVGLASRYALPTIYTRREFALAGGLASYGASFSEMYRHVGVYTGRILKGAKPSELPVMQPTKFDFVINLKTAKALGLNLRRETLSIADEVIE